MTQFPVSINDELIDSVGFTRLSSHFRNEWEVFLTHRIGSVKDAFQRPIGRYTSGKGVHADFLTAYELAVADLNEKVAKALAEQNAKPPGASPALSLKTDDADLLKLLDL